MNNLFENLRTHIFIEFFFRTNKGLINEQRTRVNKRKLFESYGIFNGCYEIAARLMDIIRQNSDKSYFSLKINNCSLIEKLEVYITDTNYAGFVTDESYINENGKYEPLTLEFGEEIIYNDDEALPLLMHELIHAYQNLKLYMKNPNNTLTSIGEKTKYFKNLEPKPYSSRLTRQLQDILYYINNFEKGGYIAQIQGGIKVNKTFLNIKQIIDFIKETTIYQNYETIIRWIAELNLIKDKRTQKDILNYVYNNSNNDFNTYNQFLKWINNEANKIQRKFYNIIPKIAYDNLRISRTMKTPDNNLLTDYYD